MLKTKFSPCLNCPDRHESCHSHCEKYLAYRRDQDEYLAMRHREGHLVSDLHYLNRERKVAWKRAWRDRKYKKERGDTK